MYAFLLFTLLSSLVRDALAVDAPPSDPFSCSPTQPCKIGCCGKNNVCGLGPDYCAPENCQSSCDSKSDCDPGWGPQWSSRETCPLNVCCSKFGFCGTTDEFCGTKTVNRPSCSGGSTASQRVIGYYESWSNTRACGGMNPEDLLSGAYTHLFFAFAFVDPNTFAVAPMSNTDKALYPRLTGLKTFNPGLKTWISIGGWSMNDPDQPTARTFSQLAADTDAQQKFFSSLLNFMSTYGFDGVDIDWEYPVAPERSGREEDYINYVSFLKNLRSALGSGGHNYGLSITLPSSYWYLQHFDLKSIEPIIDFFQMMTYDIHGTWDSTNPYVGANVAAHTNLTEIEQGLDLLWRNGINPKNVNLGIGFYGRSFTLADPGCKAAGCPFSAGGKPGKCTASAGTLSYSEIQDIVAAGAPETIDSKAGVAIVTWDNDQWVSYDNEETLRMKMDYANSRCLGGVMIWAASTDDGEGTAIQTLNKVAGRSIQSKALRANAPGQGVGQCVWGECGTACPSGLTPVTNEGGKQNGYAGLVNGCEKGQNRYYCCPSDDVPASCTWRGGPHFCGLTGGADCHNDEVRVTSKTDGCWTGHKNFCCKKTNSDSDNNKCTWSGSAPICAASALLGFPFSWDSADCPSDKSNKVTTSVYGNGGEQPCSWRGGYKSFCCSSPVPYTGCKWYQGSGSWISWANAILPVFGQKCQGECPKGKVPIATDPSSCSSGYSYFCCDNPNAPSIAAPGDSLVCDEGANPAGSSPEPDPDESSTAGGIYDEGESVFASDCSLPNGPFEVRRWLESEDFIHVFANETYLRVRDDLVKRGVIDKKSIMALCIAGKEVGKVSPQTYPGAQSLIKNFRRTAYVVGKPLACGALQLTPFSGVPDQEIVAEHVFEKQQFRDLLARMGEGLSRSGSKIRAGALQVGGVFGDNGIFYQQWPNINDLPERFRPYGQTIHDTFMGVLGRTADRGAADTVNVDNLQVLSRTVNGMKALVFKGNDFISEDTWKKLTPLGKISGLSNLIATFDYMNIGDPQTSYRTTYEAIYGLMGNFQKVLADRGIQYDAQGATQEIIKADLTTITSNTKILFNELLNQALEYWQSDAAKFGHTEEFCAAAVEALNSLKDDATNSIVLNTQKLIGS